MKTFKLKIINPQKIMFDGDAVHCGITTPSGSIGFEARHEPQVALLAKNSEIRVRDSEGNQQQIAVKDGILTFKDNTCTITVTPS